MRTVKYVIEFVSEEGGAYNTHRIFGETDVKGVAEICFEMGKNPHYKSIIFKRVKKDGELDE